MDNSRHKETSMFKKLAFTAITFAALAGLAIFAQEVQTEKITVPLSNPGKPALVEVQLFMGSIKITGTDGKDVIVEAKPLEKSLTGEDRGTRVAQQADRINRIATRMTEAFGEQEKEKSKEDKAAGLKKIPLSASGLTVEEYNNRVSIEIESFRRAYDLDIKVPAGASLKIEASNVGEIRVENVSGEIEIESVSGRIVLQNVAGPVVASTNNGHIEAVFTRVAPDKPMSFATFNGDVDLTLPADAKATFKIKSQMGDVYSDFDLALKATPVRTEETGKASGRFRVSIERAVQGAINGGGAEFKVETYNGSVYLRKKK
jgi:hypothetical protein